MQKIQVAMAVIRQGDLYHLQLRNHKTSSGVSNMIGCFGGRIEKDEKPLSAVCREVSEETSLKPKTKDFTFLGEVNVKSEYHGDSVVVSGFIYSLEIHPEDKIVSKEGELVSLNITESADNINNMTPGTRAAFKQYILEI